jgi:EAL domain-containing protein (putative c-di-GMP-specific phosphodiesterase class I)
VPSSVRWGRLQDYEFALLWDNGPGFDDYLETVRAAARPISTVSIGVADSAVPDTPIQLLTKALAGVAYSERSGGNRVTRHGLVATQVDELSAAIATGQISVFYQPIVAIADGRICGAEALARWIHPERGVIAPADFIGVAEQADLIGALGAQVLRRACVDAAEWRCDGDVAPKVTVNVSGQQLHDAGFVSIVRDSLRRSGLDAWRLVLEVTETTVAGDDPQALSALRELRGHGVKVAIDDFGTGYSNLSRLAGLPIDVLKLDRSFVAQIEHSPRILALVRNIIAMARDLDLLTVAEGVETQEQADLLRAVGAPEGQGWLWSAPVPADQFVLARAGTPDRPVAKQITT